MANEVLQRIGDIEDAIVERLQAKGLGVREFAIADDPRSLVTPALNVALWQGKIDKTGKSWFFDLTYVATFAFKSLRDEKARRRGVYPLLMAALSYLAGRKLSLNGVELSMRELRPGRVRKELDRDGIIAFSVELSTGFWFDPVSDEEAQALSAIAIEYILKPGDDIADLEAVVTNE